MTSPNTCPSPDTLVALADGTLSAAEADAVGAHLDGCAACQAAVDGLPDESNTRVEWVRRLTVYTGPADPVVQRLVSELLPERAADTPGHSEDTRPVPADHADVLGLLAKSTHEGALGRLGHYEILGVVGRGGMGCVLKALDTQLQRIVAVKTLAPSLAATPVARKLFGREARAAAAVSHEHVVAVHAVEEDAPLPFLVMQFVAGQSLAEKLWRGGALGLTEVLRFGSQIAGGLAAAHAQGIVHRDIKPGNILLENGGERVKITDFGLARVIGDGSLSHSGVAVGTPMYMSPEQARGDSVDPRSDLFSLGSVLYAMCCGRPPFRGGTALAVLKRVCDDEPPPLCEVNPAVPAWVAVVVGKLMAKSPADRYATAAEVAALLAQCLAELQEFGEVRAVLTPGPSRPAPPAPNRKRFARRAAAGLLIVVPAALVAAAAGAFRPPVAAIDWEDIDRRGRQVLRVHKDGHLSAVVTPPPVPTAAELAGRDSPLDQLAATDIPAGAREKAGNGDASAAPPELVAVFGVTDGHKGLVHALAFSPDGKTLASIGVDGEVKLWDCGTGKLRFKMSGHAPQRGNAVAFTPDSQTLLSVGNDSRLVSWSAATGEKLAEQFVPGMPTGVAVSPDGKTAATVTWLEGTVRTHVIGGTDEEQKRIATVKVAGWAVAFSPDGEELITMHDRGGYEWSLRSMKWRMLPEHGQRMALHPAGRLLATPTNAVRVWDIKGWREAVSFAAHDRGLGGIAWRPDGELLATCGGVDGLVRVWDASTRRPRSHTISFFTRGVESVHDLKFSPDGRHLATGNPDGTISILRLAPKGVVFRVP